MASSPDRSGVDRRGVSGASARVRRRVAARGAPPQARGRPGRLEAARWTRGAPAGTRRPGRLEAARWARGAPAGTGRRGSRHGARGGAVDTRRRPDLLQVRPGADDAALPAALRPRSSRPRSPPAARAHRPPLFRPELTARRSRCQILATRRLRRSVVLSCHGPPSIPPLLHPCTLRSEYLSSVARGGRGAAGLGEAHHDVRNRHPTGIWQVRSPETAHGPGYATSGGNLAGSGAAVRGLGRQPPPTARSAGPRARRRAAGPPRNGRARTARCRPSRGGRRR